MLYYYRLAYVLHCTGTLLVFASVMPAALCLDTICYLLYFYLVLTKWYVNNKLHGECCASRSKSPISFLTQIWLHILKYVLLTSSPDKSCDSYSERKRENNTEGFHQVSTNTCFSAASSSGERKTTSVIGQTMSSKCQISKLLRFAFWLIQWSNEKFLDLN